MTDSIERFTIHVEQAVLDDLHSRLRNARLPKAIPGVGWDYGVDVAYLHELIEYWRAHFDWRAVEHDLARWNHFVAPVLPARGEEQIRLHFLHERSPHAEALPLLLTHGWPGSILEFRKMIDPLVDPVRYGGSKSDAFHVVCPSLPGYGFSQAPRKRGFDIKKVALTLAALMRDLGYSRYGAQGGDWGAMANSYVALLDPEHCVGLHLNLVLAPPPGDGLGDLTAEQLGALQSAREYMSKHNAYQRVQGLEPDLIGLALNDSPAALCAWIVSKFRTWSDCDGDVEKRFTKDELLANVTWYWVTQTAASSARLYYESMQSGRFGPVEGRVEVPTGCALFPRELFRPPRAWVERLFNVRHWTEMKAGGHFAAMEEPVALVDDVRTFFRGLRG